MTNIAIIGGGIAGLTTAYYLQKQARENNIDNLTITLIESAEQVGGKINTDTSDGFVIEGGPDSFITQKPWALQLAREIGLEDEIVGTNDDRRKVYILRKGKLYEMPDGLMLVVPTKFMPFVKSRLISWMGKLRMGMDLFIKPRKEDTDESLADFMRRRLGNEALEVLGEPMLAGIHVSDAETLSLKATFPRFHDIERKYGSLTKGMIAARKNRPPTKGKKMSMFVTMKGGLQRFANAIADTLDDVNIITGQKVHTVQEHVENGYIVALEDGTNLQADHVILATPSYIAANLLDDKHSELKDMLNAIRYVNTATISLGYEASTFDHPLDGFGFVIPRTEPTKLLACTWTSTKFNHRAPDNHVLLRVFVGGPRRQEHVELDDDTLIQMVRDELKTIMGITATPTITRVFRWVKSNPQYDVGHLDRVGRMEALCPDGIYLTGSAYRGVGLPDCTHQGQLMAEKVIKAVLEKSQDAIMA